MKAYINSSSIYDFVFSREEAEQLSFSLLETDLLDPKEGHSLGKKVRLKFAEPEFGDAQIDTEPKNAGWENAKTMIITARPRYLETAKLEGHSNARLGSMGDVYFHLEG